MTYTLDKKVRRRKLYTTGDIAVVLQVAPRTVSKWFDAGLLKGYRIPGSLDRRIPHANVIRFLTAHGLPIPREIRDEAQVIVAGADGVLADQLRQGLGAAAHLHIASTGFDVGRLAMEFAPVAALIVDTRIGRSEAIGIQARMAEVNGETLRLTVVQEDEQEAEMFGSSGVYRRPFDAALLVEQVMGVVGTED